MDEALDEFGLAQAITTMNGKEKTLTKDEDFSKKCGEMNDAIKTLRRYNKECNSALTQQVFSAILRTRSQMIEKYCSKPSSQESKDLVVAINCVANDAFDEVTAAEKKTVVTMEALFDKNIQDEKLRVRGACCNVLSSKNNFIDATKAKCDKHKKFYDEYYESYTSEAMGLICPEADKLDCDKLETIKTDGLKPKAKFFIAPSLHLVKTLDH